MLVKKQFKIDSAHFIKDHPKCGLLHGHTFLINFYLEGNLNKEGMVIDFHDLGVIAKSLLEPLDHRTLNDVLRFTPLTAETLAIYLAGCFAEIIFRSCPNISKVWVSVQEGLDGGTAMTGYDRKKEINKLEKNKKRQTDSSKDSTSCKRYPRSSRKGLKRSRS